METFYIHDLLFGLKTNSQIIDTRASKTWTCLTFLDNYNLQIGHGLVSIIQNN